MMGFFPFHVVFIYQLQDDLVFLESPEIVALCESTSIPSHIVHRWMACSNGQYAKVVSSGANISPMIYWTPSSPPLPNPEALQELEEGEYFMPLPDGDD
ncbi:hypothetical protein E1B28_001976 [Marasmius oreades]|uniref:Uncharacterized protein n=1 Tax=Marasmius oreades TaxID=181124 RepID=A0A9P7V4P3_9AGAR|nr:uncharacterized protein E1B28_001976 [Marasmius oreades]KAG7100201.1 hypothetical protein E1B28_001976 [Marasmius oreades]